MLAEFIRLRSEPQPHGDLNNQRAFVCELPDIRTEQLEKWRTCGHVVATADQGRIISVSIDLNDILFEEIKEEGESFDPEEIMRSILLSIGWERWQPMSRTSVKLKAGRKTVDAVYSAKTDKLSWQEKDDER